MNRHWCARGTAFLLCSLALATNCPAGDPPLPPNYDLEWWTVDGGVAPIGAGTTSLFGSLGQPDVGVIESGPTELQGGFLFGYDPALLQIEKPLFVVESAGYAKVRVLAPEVTDVIPGVPVTIDYTTQDGSASAGSQYASTSGTLTFDSEHRERIIAIPITDNQAAGLDTTFSLTLANASGFPLRSAATRTIRIQDDDSGPLSLIQMGFVYDEDLGYHADGEYWEQQTGASPPDLFQIRGAAQFDYLGSGSTNGIVLGDFNGDGYDDVLVGAAAKAYIIYGSPSRSAMNVDLADSANYDVLFERSSGWFGNAVAAADFNGDGYDDALIANAGGLAGFGGVFLKLGGPSLASTYNFNSDSLPEYDLLITPNRSATGPHYAANFDRWLYSEFGSTLVTGNFNGDQYEDILVGAPHANPAGGDESAGEAYVFFGGPNVRRLPSQRILYLEDPIEESAEGIRISGFDEQAQVGRAVAAGDLNGDGYDEALLGAPFADVGTTVAAGKVFAVYTSGMTSFPTEVTLDDPPTLSVLEIGGEEAEALFGSSLGAGDFNGDGYQDLVVGAPFFDDALNPEDSGKVYVLLGRAEFSPSLGPLVVDDLPSNQGMLSFLGEDGPDKLEQDGNGDYVRDLAGMGAAIGDFNSDGIGDILIASAKGLYISHVHFSNPYDYYPYTAQSGMVFVVYGSVLQSGSPDAIALERVLDKTVPGSFQGGALPGDSFGWGIQGEGDLDGDGLAEYIASAPYADYGGKSLAGYVGTVYGKASGSSAVSTMPVIAGDGVGTIMSNKPIPPIDYGPVVRCVIDHEDNNGRAASMDTVYVIRTSPPDVSSLLGLGQPNEFNVAGVHWIYTSSLGSGADYSARVRFKYTDGEIGDLDERTLQLYAAPWSWTPPDSPLEGQPGAWQHLPDQKVDIRRNRIEAMTVGASSQQAWVFAIVGASASGRIQISMDRSSHSSVHASIARLGGTAQ